jgi:hypothetical protein
LTIIALAGVADDDKARHGGLGFAVAFTLSFAFAFTFTLAFAFAFAVAFAFAFALALALALALTFATRLDSDQRLWAAEQGQRSDDDAAECAPHAPPVPR